MTADALDRVKTAIVSQVSEGDGSVGVIQLFRALAPTYREGQVSEGLQALVEEHRVKVASDFRSVQSVASVMR